MIENITPPPALTALAATVTSILYTGSVDEEPSPSRLALGLESGLLIPFDDEGFAHAIGETLGNDTTQMPSHPCVNNLAERIGCIPSARVVRDVMDIVLAHTRAHLANLRARTPGSAPATTQMVAVSPPSFADMLATVDRNIEAVLARGVA
jgi:hypothetical protein